MIDYIMLDLNSSVPKYIQIIDCIVNNISKGQFKIGDKMPSMSKLSKEFYISKDTVERAYRVLKKRRIIITIQGKGTYIAETRAISKPKILFLVNKLSPYKIKVYNSFLEQLEDSSIVDIHSYHCDETLFLELMKKYESSYDYYVIMPHFRTKNLLHVSTTDKVTEVIKKIPKENLVLLDNSDHKIEGDFNEVYQDYKNDVIDALNKGNKSIAKYNTITIVYPKTSFYPYPKSILEGFKQYCAQNSFKFKIIEEVTLQTSIAPKNLFITLVDNDLVKIVNKIKSSKYKLGKDIGVISYNDSPLKQLLGITVISTNFSSMGKEAARMIFEKKKEKVQIPVNFINRESL
ncbi:GntR family transcriptional regulator [uncultured Polaribacter sp.]|uniref:GntR family transcriptional regulator n=1 Tax=uncultured Polaribacter sp. TaxID=174711 RepID=UPI0026035124|nr:GntR family transcriptional regulator [uncultured Polaribacter sp.]